MSRYRARHSHIRVPNGLIAQLMTTASIRAYRRDTGSGIYPELPDGEIPIGWWDFLDGIGSLPKPEDDFTRASTATYQSNVPIYEDVPTGEMTYGPELIANGTFDDGMTGWGGFWSVTNGVATGNPGGQALNPDDFVPTVGKTYRVVFTCITSPYLAVRLGGVTLGTNWADDTVYEREVTALTTENLSFAAGGGSDSSVDNISLREATPVTEPVIVGYEVKTAAVDEPRFEYEIVQDGWAPSPVAENLFIWSEEYSGDGWIRNRVTIDGSRVVESSTTATHNLTSYTFSGTVGDTMTYKMRVGPGTRRYGAMFAAGSNEGGVEFDLEAGLIKPAAGFSDPVDYSMTPDGDGFYVVEFSVVLTSTSAATAVYTLEEYDFGARSYAGDGVSYLDVTYVSAYRPIVSSGEYVKTEASPVVSEWGPYPAFEAVPIGYLAEPAAENSLYPSSDLTHGNWGVSNATSDNVSGVLDPTGDALSVSELTDSTAHSRHITYFAKPTYSSGVDTVASVYLKAGTLNYGMMSLSGTGARLGILVDLTTGEITYVRNEETPGPNDDFKWGVIRQGEWTRLWVSGAFPSDGTAYLEVATSNTGTPAEWASGSPEYTGDGTGTIYAYGAQWELGTAATSYIPTTTAAVTRAADNYPSDISAFGATETGPERVTNGTFDAPKPAENHVRWSEDLFNAVWYDGFNANANRSGPDFQLTGTGAYMYVNQDGLPTGELCDIMLAVTCDQTITDVPIRVTSVGNAVSALVDLVAGVQTEVMFEGLLIDDTLTTINIGLDNRPAAIPGASQEFGYTVTFDKVSFSRPSVSSGEYVKTEATAVVSEWPYWNLDDQGTDAIISADTGVLRVTTGTSHAMGYQAFDTVVGKTYEMSGTIVATDDSGMSFWAIRKSDQSNGGGVNTINIVDSTIGSDSGTFVATSTTTYVVCQCNNAGNWAEFDNITVKDITAGLAVGGTVYAMYEGRAAAELTGITNVGVDVTNRWADMYTTGAEGYAVVYTTDGAVQLGAPYSEYGIPHRTAYSKVNSGPTTIAQDGVIKETGTGGEIVSDYSLIYIGSRFSNTAQLNGHVKQIGIYSPPLDDIGLIALTAGGGRWSDDLLLNGDFNMRGDELIVNGGFDSGDNWNLTGDFSIANSLLNIRSDSGSFYNAGQDGVGSPLGADALCVVTANQTRVSVGGAKVYFSGVLQRIFPPEVGVLSLVITKSGSTSDTFNISRNAGVTDVDWDDVSVKEIGQHWDFSAVGWSLEDDGAGGFHAVCDGSQAGASELTQTIEGTADGDVAQIEFTASGVSGNTRLWFGGTAGDFIDDGPNVQTITRGGSSFLKFIAEVSGEAIIDKVTVRKLLLSGSTEALATAANHSSADTQFVDPDGPAPKEMKFYGDKPSYFGTDGANDLVLTINERGTELDVWLNDMKTPFRMKWDGTMYRGLFPNIQATLLKYRGEIVRIRYMEVSEGGR